MRALRLDASPVRSVASGYRTKTALNKHLLCDPAHKPSAQVNRLSVRMGTCAGGVHAPSTGHFSRGCLVQRPCQGEHLADQSGRERHGGETSSTNFRCNFRRWPSCRCTERRAALSIGAVAAAVVILPLQHAGRLAARHYSANVTAQFAGARRSGTAGP